MPDRVPTECVQVVSPRIIITLMDPIQAVRLSMTKVGGSGAPRRLRHIRSYGTVKAPIE